MTQLGQQLTRQAYEKPDLVNDYVQEHLLSIFEQLMQLLQSHARQQVDVS